MTGPPTPRDVRVAYDQWHTAIPAEEQEETPWHALVRRYLEPGRDLAGRRVLEIGCGRGSLARRLVSLPEHPSMVVAADLSGTAVLKARSAALDGGSERIEWHVCDIQALPFASASFDTVISCETIEHIAHPRRALGELARVLRNGGRLFLTTPSYLNAMGAYRAYLRIVGRRYAEAGQPVNRFTILPRTVAWVRRVGLRVEWVDGEGHYLPFPGRHPIVVATNLPPRRLTRWLGVHSLVCARKPSA